MISAEMAVNGSLCKTILLILLRLLTCHHINVSKISNLSRGQNSCMNMPTHKRIHVNPPRSSGSLPEMQPASRTPRSETEPPGCENIKKTKIFF